MHIGRDLGRPSDYVGSTSGVPQVTDDPVASLNSAALGHAVIRCLAYTVCVMHAKAYQPVFAGGAAFRICHLTWARGGLGSGSILPFYTSNKEAMVATAFSASARSGWVVSSSKP
jgi:hypothetical protein